jgi:hypothetical protein
LRSRLRSQSSSAPQVGSPWLRARRGRAVEEHDFNTREEAEVKKRLTLGGLFLFLLVATPIIVLSVGTSGVAASGSKPPSSLCLDYAGFSDFQMLSIKSAGTLKTVDGTVKAYSVNGFSFNGDGLPVSGSAYVLPGTTTLVASYTGLHDAVSTFPSQQNSYTLVYDLATQSGAVNVLFNHSDASAFTQSGIPVTSTSCDGLQVTASPPPGAAGKAAIGSQR